MYVEEKLVLALPKFSCSDGESLHLDSIVAT